MNSQELIFFVTNIVPAIKCDQPPTSTTCLNAIKCNKIFLKIAYLNHVMKVQKTTFVMPPLLPPPHPKIIILKMLLFKS